MSQEDHLETMFISYLDKRKFSMEAMNSKEANAFLDKAFEVVREIWKLEGNGSAMFRRLINDRNPYIVLASAQSLLPIDEDAAIRVLEALTNSDVPEIATFAEITLDEWKSGGLQQLRNMDL